MNKMAYRLSRELFIENGPAVTAADALSTSASRAFRVWRGLDEVERLAAVEQALKVPANDFSHLPIAL
jgi:hypothetical protein